MTSANFSSSRLARKSLIENTLNPTSATMQTRKCPPRSPLSARQLRRGFLSRTSAGSAEILYAIDFQLHIFSALAQSGKGLSNRLAVMPVKGHLVIREPVAVGEQRLGARFPWEAGYIPRAFCGASNPGESLSMVDVAGTRAILPAFIR